VNYATAGLVAALLLTLTGCAMPAAHPVPSAPPASPSAAPQPAEPAQLTFDKVNPCQLLTADQLTTLDAVEVPSSPTHEPGDNYCGWGSNKIEVNASWIAELVFGQPFPTTLDSPGPERTLQIEGYTVLEGSNPNSTPKTSCIQFINIAPNQTLQTSYVADGTSGVNHQKACESATQFSTMLINNLHALTGH
jgi:hypothetical protein